MTAKAKKAPTAKKHNRFEIFDCIFFGVIWLLGVIFGVLGIYALNTPHLSNNPIYQAEKAMSDYLKWPFGFLDWRLLGLVIMAIGLIGLLIAFYYFANKVDREKLKGLRRAERLQAIMANEDILLKKPLKNEKDD